MLEPERLEDDIEEKTATQLFKVVPQEIEKISSSASLFVLVDPIQWQDTDQHFLSDFVISLDSLEADLWRRSRDDSALLDKRSHLLDLIISSDEYSFLDLFCVIVSTKTVEDAEVLLSWQTLNDYI